ncbi:MAG: hypothetical protein KJ712_07595 [Bacteroidetes bacterium]|nr:hypothetical protein [Bacteroidota bacterium]
MKKNLLFSALILCSTLFSCTTIYYVGETTSITNIYLQTDTTSYLTYSIPSGTKVLSRKRGKKYNYLMYKNFFGYAYNPSFSNYHKYNSTTDGNLYGYSSYKPSSTSNSTSSGSGTVHVKGYTRKDGTYVQPHTRSAPRKH